MMPLYTDALAGCELRRQYHLPDGAAPPWPALHARALLRHDELAAREVRAGVGQ
jgi:hypothetical protein